MDSILVFLLADNCIYVERVGHLEDFLQFAKSKKAPQWLQIHPILSLDKRIQIPCGSSYRHIVIGYMEKYGIRRVRGGPFQSVHLSNAQYAAILDEMEVVHTCVRVRNKPLIRVASILALSEETDRYELPSSCIGMCYLCSPIVSSTYTQEATCL